MAGNKNSGVGPKIVGSATRGKLQDAALKIFHKHMSDPDPDDIRHPSRLKKQIEKLYQWSISDNKDAVTALKASLEWTLGKAVTPMQLEVTRSPEENVNAIFEAIAKLKQSEQSEEMEDDTNGAIQ